MKLSHCLPFRNTEGNLQKCKRKHIIKVYTKLYRFFHQVAVCVHVSYINNFLYCNDLNLEKKIKLFTGRSLFSTDDTCLLNTLIKLQKSIA